MTHYFRFEIRRLTRDTRFLFFTVATPLGMYVLFSSIGAHSTQQSRVLEMVGMATYAALMVTLTNGGNIAADRALGWIAALRTTPIGVRGITLAKTACGLALALPTILCVYAVGAFVQHIHLSPLAWLGAIAVTWLGSVPFALLGMALGYTGTPQSAGPMVMASTLTLAALGGLWIPTSLLPSTLRHISAVLPTHGWADISQRIAISHPFRISDVVMLLAWSGVFAILATVAYRRSTPR